jgi:predicted nucleic acid-binding protein
VIICDTSFVSVVQLTPRHELEERWPADVLTRIDDAVLAITPFTVAEQRCGHLYAGWSEERRAQAERMLSPYLMVLITPPVIDCWAVLAADLKRRGKKPPQNDIWIGATAIARDCAAVSCDGHFNDFAGLEHIHLPRR